MLLFASRRTAMAPAPPCAFADTKDACGRLTAARYCCVFNPGSQTGFWVSREPIVLDEVCNLRKAGRFELQLWKGKAYVAGLHLLVGFDGSSRDWALHRAGNVQLLGDRAFLDEMATVLAGSWAGSPPPDTQ
jgi:hypothetical protein